MGQMDAGQASRITAQPAVEMLRGTKLQKRNINCSSEKSPAVHPFKSSETLCPRVSTLTEGFLRKGEMADSEGREHLARGDIQPLSLTMTNLFL